VRSAIAIAAAAAALAAPALHPDSVRADSVSTQRALASFDAMERSLFHRGAGDYREQAGGAPGSHAWPYSQALAAHVAVAKLNRHRAAVGERLALLERRFRLGAVYAAWPRGDVYLDDNEWIAEAYLDLGGAHARARAAAIFDAVVRAWDASASTPCSGGVYWTHAHGNDDRNTVSTANGALVGLRLYRSTHVQRYLTWSRRMLAWVETCMRDTDNLYWDHIDASGNVDRTKWSYNQGSMLGAYVELYRSTGEQAALDEAESIADAALAYFAPRWADGEPREFASVFFRNLLQLAGAARRDDYVDAAAAYGNALWASTRNGLFAAGGATTLLDQAAIVQLYAALARAGR